MSRRLNSIKVNRQVRGGLEKEGGATKEGRYK